MTRVFPAAVRFVAAGPATNLTAAEDFRRRPRPTHWKVCSIVPSPTSPPPSTGWCRWPSWATWRSAGAVCGPPSNTDGSRGRAPGSTACAARPPRSVASSGSASWCSVPKPWSATKRPAGCTSSTAVGTTTQSSRCRGRAGATAPASSFTRLVGWPRATGCTSTGCRARRPPARSSTSPRAPSRGGASRRRSTRPSARAPRRRSCWPAASTSTPVPAPPSSGDSCRTRAGTRRWSVGSWPSCGAQGSRDRRPRSSTAATVGPTPGWTSCSSPMSWSRSPGGRGHASDAERANDARRRNELQDAGRRVFEFTTADVFERPAYVVTTMRSRLRSGWRPDARPGT